MSVKQFLCTFKNDFWGQIFMFYTLLFNLMYYRESDTPLYIIQVQINNLR